MREEITNAAAAALAVLIPTIARTVCAVPTNVSTAFPYNNYYELIIEHRDSDALYMAENA